MTRCRQAIVNVKRRVSRRSFDGRLTAAGHDRGEDATRTILYGIRHSHSVLAARLMLEHAGLAHEARDLLPGLHPLVVRAAGFSG